MSKDSGRAKKPGTAGTDEGMLTALVARRLPPVDERKASRWRWVAIGGRPEPPPGYRGLYERPGSSLKEDVGICCSGGGIRSAAFNLGALQVLQNQGILQSSKYISAVSGGSYIAAAFCMVAKTWDPEKHRCPPTAGDDADDSDPDLVTDKAPPFSTGSPDEQYLRNHLGYLAPDGLARVYLALRMLAGMLVNVVIVGLPVFLVGVLGGWAVDVHYGGLGDEFELPKGAWIPVVVVAGLSLAVALLGVLMRLKRDWQRQLLETWQVRLFLVASAGAVALIGVPWLARNAFKVGDAADAVKPGSAAVGSMAALALAAYTQVRGHVKDQQKAVKAVQGRMGRFAKPVREALVSLVVILVGPLLLVAICALGVLVGDIAADVGETVDLGPLGHVTIGLLSWIVGSAALLFVLWVAVDLTSVSLHPFYRRRLASAFALKRVRGVDGKPVARERNFDRIVELSKSGIEPGPCTIKSWPMLIVCAAANISDPGATPPGRGVASFTFSPKAIGGPVTGAEKTSVYEKLRRNRKRDVTLPAAVAMSGAALSPSMGKLTYRPLTFLLGLANIRLGVWVPNPLHVNDPQSDAPVDFPRRPRPHYLVKEMLGRNRLEDKFLYVTDGGHYENLGLVELLRRGCRTIYCFDAGGGTTAQALVDAIALARTELDVTIDMECKSDELEATPVSDANDAARRAKAVCAVGKITYQPAATGGRAVEGLLIYCRSVVTEDAPWQVRSFQTDDPVFPHHSTMDQFFDDQKFEAYRRLGSYVAATAATEVKGRLAAAEAARTNGGKRRRRAAAPTT